MERLARSISVGLEISERSVSRMLGNLPRRPRQNWKTFLRNHLGQMVSIDLFTVPTMTRKVLFVFIVLEHRRREVLHFGVDVIRNARHLKRTLSYYFAYYHGRGLVWG